ncbi:MAG: hypothetical protein ACFFE8_02490 [Candidatus Heimdallarchaeota archaeon]
MRIRQSSTDRQEGVQIGYEIQSLRDFLSNSRKFARQDILKLWRGLDRMRIELNIARETSILELFALYQSFEEIKSVLSLDNSFNNFHLLNDLYVEILEYRQVLEIPPRMEMAETLKQITRNFYLISEEVNSSLLGKILGVASLKNEISR